MTVLPALIGTPLLVLGAWAFLVGDASATIDFLTSTPWGIAITTDLYTGFALFGVLVWHLERNAVRAIAWMLPTLVLGNVVFALYLALHLRTIAARPPGSPAASQDARP